MKIEIIGDLLYIIMTNNGSTNNMEPNNDLTYNYSQQQNYFKI